MNVSWLAVIIFRLLVPFIMLKFPLIGFLLSMLADFGDMNLLQLLGVEDLNNYQGVDKVLDLFFLSLAFFISLKWKNLLAKRTAVFLFLYRFIGFVVFEVTQKQYVLLFFPNLFEFFFIFYLVYKHFYGDAQFNKKTLVISLFLLLIPKLYQEYYLHLLLPAH